MLIDDYGLWDGCTRAVHEYLGPHRRPKTCIVHPRVARICANVEFSRWRVETPTVRSYAVGSSLRVRSERVKAAAAESWRSPRSAEQEPDTPTAGGPP